ncbi:hypothetical protein ACH5RR_032618 [Cinchona calisaya]|uniref:Uncharacterized protein n=1 Tax=Cinchona calisaya TaxID=153742 RepID=A0ABD2YKL8_9GENT
MHSTTEKVSLTREEGCGLEKVNDLIKVKWWDMDALKGNFNQEDIDLITTIPISMGDLKDRWIWSRVVDGSYSVKTEVEIEEQLEFQQEEKMGNGGGAEGFNRME